MNEKFWETKNTYIITLYLSASFLKKPAMENLNKAGLLHI
jgi:hypothetical protein